MAPKANGKRRIDVIDLTDDHPLESQSRKAPRSLLAGASTQSQRDTWADRDEEEDADDVIILSQDGDNSATESFELYGNLKFGGLECRVAIGVLTYVIGVLTTKIVGVQYYNGYATEGEFVIIRREPTNPVCILQKLLFFLKK